MARYRSTAYEDSGMESRTSPSFLTFDACRYTAKRCGAMDLVLSSSRRQENQATSTTNDHFRWSNAWCRVRTLTAINTHEPVLKHELVRDLVTDASGCYVDATFGRGGHASEILAQLTIDGRLVGLDRDAEAAKTACDLDQADPRFKFVQTKFSELETALQDLDIESVDGVCFDVGVSTPQLKNAQRGFAFDIDGPLDMRMDNESGQTAAMWLNSASPDEISTTLHQFGDVRSSRAIAKRIVAERPLRTTTQLARAIKATAGSRGQTARQLAQVFQAIRIRINDELNELSHGLEAALQQVRVGGRIAVITFHSLEHRLVRNTVRAWIQPEIPRGLPVRNALPRVQYVSKNVRPSYDERQRNRQARSAMMQVVERLR